VGEEGEGEQEAGVWEDEERQGAEKEREEGGGRIVNDRTGQAEMGVPGERREAEERGGLGREGGGKALNQRENVV